MQILGAYNFRVTRDADIEIAEDEAEDLLHEISEHIRERRWGMQPVRLELNPNFPNELLDFILEYLGLSEEDVYVYSRPLNLPDFMVLLRLDLPALKDQPFTTRIIKEFQGDNGAIFEAISQKDYLVHHPYDSFSNSVLRFLNIASTDPDVLLIKITLYRTDSNSPILEALKLAAENGKSVTAFVELKARFDEENNIVWAKKLEKSGVHVVYGVPHLKTHCKICHILFAKSKTFFSLMCIYQRVIIIKQRQEFILILASLLPILNLEKMLHYCSIFLQVIPIRPNGSIFRLRQ